MTESFDVAIVGAGPAGTSAAITLAQKGVKTVVFERGEYPGAKNISGGVIYGHDLAQVLPDFAEKNPPIERSIIEMRGWYLSEQGGYNVSYRDAVFTDERRYNCFTVGRAKFDRWFAEQARAKGALIVCSTVVTDLLRDESGKVVGVIADRPDGVLRAKVVLLADGINSPLAASTGFRPEVKPEHVALAVKEIVELPEEVICERFGVPPGYGVTTEILGSITWGMNGVGVLYTNRNSLSLCIGANLQDFQKHKVHPYDMLEAFKAHPMVAPLVKDGKPKEYMAHWLAEGGYDTIPQLVGDGYLIAGDSAMLFNAPHREGSNLAMTSGRLAAEAIAEALVSGDTSRRGLERYVTLLQQSYVLQDMKKYRRFGPFLHRHHEIFTTLPGLASMAAREIVTVDGVPKKEKQKRIWSELRRHLSLSQMARLAWDAWRAVR